MGARRTAIDCLQRGALACMANPELVLVQLVQNVVLIASVLVSLLVPLVLLGLGVELPRLLDELPEALPEAAGELVAGLAGRAVGAWPAVVLAVLAALVLGTVAMLVYAWFLGATLGVLRAADRRAPWTAAEVAAFRVFGWPALLAAGRALLGRTFWFLSAMLGIVLVGAVACLLVIGLLALLAGDRPVLAFGGGCLGAICGLVAVLVALAWSGLGIADLPREDSGVWVAMQRAWEVLWRRLGAVLLLYLVYLAVFGGLTAAGTAVQMLLALVADGVVETMLGILATCGEMVVGGALTLVLTAALVVLMGSEGSASNGSMFPAAPGGGWPGEGADGR